MHIPKVHAMNALQACCKALKCSNSMLSTVGTQIDLAWREERDEGWGGNEIKENLARFTQAIEGNFNKFKDVLILVKNSKTTSINFF